MNKKVKEKRMFNFFKKKFVEKIKKGNIDSIFYNGKLIYIDDVNALYLENEKLKLTINKLKEAMMLAGRYNTELSPNVVNVYIDRLLENPDFELFNDGTGECNL